MDQYSQHHLKVAATAPEHVVRKAEFDAAIGSLTDHAALTNRDAANQHPIAAIDGLTEELERKVPLSRVSDAPINDEESEGDSLALPTVATVRNYVNGKLRALPQSQSLAFYIEQFDYDGTNTFSLQYAPKFVFHVYVVKENLFVLAEFTFDGTWLTLVNGLEEGDRIQVQYVYDQ